MLYLIWAVIALVAFVLYARKVHSKFAKAGVNHLPVLPVVGNSAETILGRDNIVDRLTKVCQAFPEDSFVGFYELLNSLIIVKDSKLVKQIAVKDFESFIDRRGFGEEFADPLLGRTLLVMKDEEWKAMRSTLSPAFTSTKIRMMIPLMVEVGDHMIRTLKKKIKDSGVNYADIESKDLGTRFANDIIASCAFGLRVESLDEGSPFYEYSKTLTTITFVRALKVLGFWSMPKVLKFFDVTMSPKTITRFFKNLVLGTMQQREEKHILRNDMIQLLMEAKKGTLSHDNKVVSDPDVGYASVEESAIGKSKVARAWQDADLVSQAVIFLVAGFETVSTVFCFAMYALALNPDVQERLLQEIKDTLGHDKNNFDYNAILHMKYLDMVVSEVLRLWPPLPVVDRKAARDYNLGRPNSSAKQDYIIRKDEIIQIPISAFHRDPKYFPDPEKFDPERFSDENKHNIDPFSYMPFGIGPRNCIGSRFALCEIKVILCQLLQHIEVSPCELTPTPAVLDNDSFRVRLKGGHWVRMTIRDYKMAFLLWVVLIVILLLLYSRKIYSKFAKAGVNHLPVIPLLGNSGHTLLRLDNIINRITLAYKAFPDDYFVGFYEIMNPLIIVKDVKLVKQIAVKDFECFVDRRGIATEFEDPLFSRNLLFLKGEEWKAMRSTLSPAFTSTKIRMMVPLMLEVGDHMIRTLKKKINDSGVNYIDIECKDLGTRYANDVIASCAFGLRVTSLEEGNQFYEYCKSMTTISFLGMLKILGYRSCPKILKMFNITLSSKTLSSFFNDLVLGTMQQREEQHILRNDMIQLLMEAKKGTLSHDSKVLKDADAGFATVEESAVGKTKVARKWSDVELVAQAVLFLLAGFETVSTVIAFALYELALHPDVQERLVREIRDNATQDKDNNIDYNAIQRMKYLDMVVSEVLRLWPPAPVADRKAARDYNLGKPNSTAHEDYIIRKGETVQIPIWAFHRDPKYFPDPEKFDPERFSDENKHKIDPFSYMPFGVGPRNCIGSRFALCELKVALYQLLQHIEVSACAKTPVPARLRPDSFQVRLAGGHWLRMKSRH